MEYRLVKILTVFVLSCFVLFGISRPVHADSGAPQWAASTVVGPLQSFFRQPHVDSSGNIYAVGYVNGNSQYDFGNSVTITGPRTPGNNAVLVKYSSSGVAQWARTVTVGPDQSYYTAITTDTSGNIYVAGHIKGTSQFDFGNSVTASGGATFGESALLIKYDSTGTAQWVSTVNGPTNATFTDLAIDSLGNLYTSGHMNGTGTYDLGSGITIAGPGIGTNMLLAKYNSSGTPLWVKSAVTAPSNSPLYGIALDTSNNIYTAGFMRGTSQYDFGNSVTLTGINSDNNALLLKYSSDGVAQWVKSAESGSNQSYFYDVTVNTQGDLYIAGAISGDSQFDFGNSVSVTGAHTVTNLLVLKYASSGIPEWARSSVTGSVNTLLYSADSDSSDNLYVSGYINGSSSLGLGNSVSVTGAHSGTNLLLARYTSSGDASWASSTVTAPDDSIFYGLYVDSNDEIYTSGRIDSAGSFDLGNSVTVSGAYSADNALLVKYLHTVSVPSSPTPTPTPTPTTSVTVGNTAASSQIVYQLAPNSHLHLSGGILLPEQASDNAQQNVTVIIEPETVPFYAFLSAVPVQPESFLPPLTTSLTSLTGSNTILAGGSILGIKSGGKLYWQIGRVIDVWYKTYPPIGSNLDPAKIIPELQNKKSRLHLSYSDTDLIPPGQPNYRFDPSGLRLAHSLDGQAWEIVADSFLDPVNQTVSTSGYLGGYYLIVGR